MTNRARAIAWLVHLYTAMGLVCAAFMAALIVRGDDASLRDAFGLMMLATAIDATDGWLARKVNVRDVLPEFDGSLLDNIIDFLTYTALPLLLLWRAGTLGDRLGWLLLLPLLASVWGFSHIRAKTHDGLFRGFPSYWNIVALYLYLLHPPAWVSVLVLVACSVLTFVPTYYIDSSKGGRFSRATNAGAAVWCALVLWVLTGRAADERVVLMASLMLVAAYLALSALVTARRGLSRSESAATRRGGPAV